MNINNEEKKKEEYTTVCIDIYGRIYDLRFEHPSWEQQKKNKGKVVFERCIVANSFYCTLEEAERLKQKNKKKRKKKGP